MIGNYEDKMHLEKRKICVLRRKISCNEVILKFAPEIFWQFGSILEYIIYPQTQLFELFQLLITLREKTATKCKKIFIIQKLF